MDGQGSVLALANDAGALQTEYAYDPFGNTTSSGESSTSSSKYTGREDDGTGLYYYRARYYSPSLQRFISEHPIGLGGGDINLYAYVGNDPINFVDPSGLCGSFSQLQATTVWAPIGGLDRMQMWLEEALKFRDCRAALQKILAQIGADTNFAPSSTDILDVFHKLRRQTGGGGIFVDVPPGRAASVIPPGAQVGREPAGGGGLSAIFYTDPRDWRTRQRTSIVFLRGAFSDSQPLAFRAIPYFYVLTLIHELTHNAPNDDGPSGVYYGHEDMDGAARKLGSRDFDRYVREHCIPRRFW